MVKRKIDLALVVLATAAALTLWVAVDVASAQTGGAEQLLPENAKPGECYTRVWVPATYKTETVDVLVREASTRIETTPAQYEWVEEQVLVREATERLEIVPATYEWVEEQMLVKPASTKLVEVPATYEWVTEQVLDRPAHTIWKKGRNPIQRVDGGTGEIMCLVTVPATYKTIKRKEVKTAAHTKVVEIPAEYETVRKQVVKTRADVRRVEIPAKYETVRTRRLATAPGEKVIDIPEKHETVTRRVLVEDGHMEWRAILCETNVHPSLVSNLQRALNAQGYNAGPVDGVVGSQTLEAIQRYQGAKGLPQGGITMETLKSLGVAADS